VKLTTKIKDITGLSYVLLHSNVLCFEYVLKQDPLKYTVSQKTCCLCFLL